MKNQLDAESSCLIYDQLVKIGDREEIPLTEVRTVIIENTPEAFGSENFTRIDQETLISLLSLKELTIKEVDLLAAVLKWVDCEVQRQDLPLNRENQRRVFQPIKGYVLFTALTPEEVAKFKIAELLTSEEAGSLISHFNNGKPFMIELKTPRRAGFITRSVFVSKLFSANCGRSRSLGLTVSRRVRIRTIYLTYSPKAPDFSFQILNDSTEEVLVAEAKRSVKDGKLCLSFCPSLDLQANQGYILNTSYGGNSGQAFEDRFTPEETLSYAIESIYFDFTPYTGYNFVRGIEFAPVVVVDGLD